MDTRLVYWGRCRSGSRWFWFAQHVDHCAEDMPCRDGWADTEDAAVEAARAAVVELAGDAPTRASVSHGSAAYRLKAINADRRKARPASDDTDAAPVEYLYALHHYVSDAGWIPDEWSVRSFRITKKTPKRVYYVRRSYAGEEPEIGFVNRQELEANGSVRNRGVHWCMDDSELFLEPPELPTAKRQPEPSLSELRKAMADSHPDRGGDRDSFQAARQAYLAARAAAV
jgi:hypothetical protein